MKSRTGPISEAGSYLNNLALLLTATNRRGEAEPLFRRALAIVEALFAPDHPAVATGLNKLATLLKATNRLGEAELLFRRALVIDEALYGRDHPDVARDLNKLATLLKVTNRLGETEPLFRRGLIILINFRRRTGHEHPNLRIVLGNYRVSLQVLGKTPDQIEQQLDDLNLRPRPDALDA